MLPQEYSARIEKANAFLNTAQLAMRNGDYESCVSRSYYAAYHMVVVLLASKANIRRKRWDHNELHRAFGEQFCKKGWLFTREDGDLFRTLQLERFSADYEVGRFSKKKAERLVMRAGALISKIQGVIQSG